MMTTEVTISCLGRIMTGKTPSTKISAFFDGDYPSLPRQTWTGRHTTCRSTERTVTEDARKTLRNQFVPENTVMVTCIGNTIGKCALSPVECLTNQQINSIIPNDGIDPKFVYYLLVKNTDLIRGVGLGGGSATPILNKTSFSKVKLRVPPKQQWSAIASVLSAYDDLIENNRRRIQVAGAVGAVPLQGMVRSSPLPRPRTHQNHRRPAGGVERKPLGIIAPLKYGKALKSDNRIPGPFPVYGSSGIVGTHIKQLVSGPTIIIGRKGNVGSVFWSPGDCQSY